jgi:hypothetical protein
VRRELVAAAAKRQQPQPLNLRILRLHQRCPALPLANPSLVRPVLKLKQHRVTLSA